MKKIILIFLLLIIGISLCFFVVNHFFWHEIPLMNLGEIKLQEKGYNQKEINYILNKLNDQEIDLILASSYLDFYDLLINKDYTYSNLNKYIAYANQNLDLKPQEIITLVNYGFDIKPYNPFYKEIITAAYFISRNTVRYLAYYELHPEYDAFTITQNVNVYLDYAFYNHDLISDTTKGILSIANKYYTLPSDFNGFDLVSVTSTNYQMTKEAYDAYQSMWQEANGKGLNFAIRSAYRSYSSQKNIHDGYVKIDGASLADTYSARAGHSEHQLGLTVDLKSLTMNTSYFELTKEYAWLINNAYQYGFILRYPEGKEYLTGYQYEPWHWRYCGIECATYIKEHDITFDEYYEYFINK